MESIILNLLNLTGEERAAFAVLAPQRFHPDGAGLTVEENLLVGTVAGKGLRLRPGDNSKELEMVYETFPRLKERRQFGRTLEHFQGLRWKAADMWAKVEAARQLTLYAARLCDGGKMFRAEASAAKLVASEAAVWCASEAVQICGGSGCIKKQHRT